MARAEVAQFTLAPTPPFRFDNFNVEWCDMIGFPEHRVRGGTFDILIGPDTDPAVMITLHKACLRSQTADVEFVAYDAGEPRRSGTMRVHAMLHCALTHLTPLTRPPSADPLSCSHAQPAPRSS